MTQQLRRLPESSSCAQSPHAVMSDATGSHVLPKQRQFPLTARRNPYGLTATVRRGDVASLGGPVTVVEVGQATVGDKRKRDVTTEGPSKRRRGASFTHAV